ncbi:hypothetical protein FNH22_25750 [Fulvivirga sp. M361]|uniref:hypothetical protein n=1 Tax=Fulvivirga sp. M361 TaxID=2594266 RepID=UPI00117B425F|nr:hypothetical protein [Fulvivirga sp. M361]TRX50447.1 hypothetical protein FNH22_25750 [Fulvivirga sp. M361]
MLTFFRLNDPYRLVIIFFLLLALRMPALISEETLTVPELNYMLVGEKLAAGESLYDGVWANIGPLSALVYGTIDFLFGRSQLAYQIFALLFVFVQAFFFNRILLINKVLNENTYIPGLIYAFLMSYFWDFFTLTPILMSVTFILLALHNIFSHIEFRARKDEMILNIGLFLGIAYLFYFPAFIFGLGTLVIFVLFTGTVIRRYFMLMYGYFLPFILTSLYFLVSGRWQDYSYSFLQPLFFGFRHWYTSYLSVLMILSVPLLLLVFSFLKMGSSGRFNNYQVRLNRAMFVWFLFSLVVVFLSDVNAPNTYVILVPSLAFYFGHFFLLMRRKWLAELTFILFIASLVYVNYGTTYSFSFFANRFHTEDYVIDNEKYKEFAGKKILVLGKDISPYRHAKMATPFLNWDISKSIFQNPDYYDNLSLIFKGFNDDMPELIIDKHAVMPVVFERIVPLSEFYESKLPGIYQLKTQPINSEIN